MSDLYNDGDLITIVDDDGQEFELEFVEEIDYNGKIYDAFLPSGMDEDDPDYGMIILRRTTDEKGQDLFDSIDDDAELDDVYQKFMILLFDDEEEDEAEN